MAVTPNNSASDRDDASFEAYRDDLLRSRLAAISFAVLGSTALFLLIIVIWTPMQARSEWLANLLILIVPLAGGLATYTPLRRYPRWVVLALYLFFAMGVTGRLFMPTAWTSGIEAFTTIAMMGSAVLVPWSPRLQAFAASSTMVMYWTAFALSGRVAVANGELPHQLTSPLFAAILSVIGVVGADRLRREAFSRRLAAERQAAINAHFAAILTHELRNLLAATQGYGEMLEIEGREAGGPLADVPERLQTVARQGLDIIEVALNLSREQHGSIAAQQKDIDLSELLEELREEFAHVEVPATIVLEWCLDAPVRMRTDPVKLKMVVRNLVANALKFTPSGRISVATKDDGQGGVLLIVSDTGNGIAYEEQANIFEPFRQGADGRLRRGSAGLGLYVVARLVESLDGTISLKSAPGEGSSFTIRLPL